ncbi:MAG: hypothetical protein FWE11_08020 [Defluviitaleaceae bacterium]|nr:hypothetical protein [Defluviitaleaceae bacterium]
MTEDNNAFGSLVASGSGRHLVKSVNFYMILLALMVVPIGLGYFLASRFGYRPVGVAGLLGFQGFGRTFWFYVFIAIGVVVAVALVGAALLVVLRMAKTEINVYNEGIAGTGVPPGIGINTSDLRPFSLMYSQIKSVEAKQGALLVGILGAEFDINIYPENPQEIKEAINSRLP